MSLFPYLFIGVGGTGGKTIGLIHYHLQQSLRRVGIYDMPLGWQFVHIDVAAHVDVRSPGLKYALDAGSYVPLTTTQTTYVGLDTQISQTLSARGRDRYLAWESWRPFLPTDVPVQHPGDGAGQYRTVGRVAAQAELAKIADAVKRALNAIRDPRVQGEFDEIERAMGRTPEEGLPAPAVLVLGSVAGGSGSGMLLDVCDVVRGAGGSGVAPDAVVFTPEVFVQPDGSMEPGIAPNTFLAICELANAMWTVNSQHPTVGRDLLFDRAGVGRPNPADRGGPRSVYLVGRSGEGVTLSDADEVYAVVARSFAEVSLDPHLSNSLRAYGAANASARATGSPDFLGLSTRQPGDPSTRQSSDLGTFGALGFGRVSLGRDFFERYATQRLMRMTVVRLLDKHLELHRKGDGKTDEQVLTMAVQRAWPAYLAATGLSEVGPEHDDVKDALDPKPALSGQLDAIQAAVLQSILGTADERGRVDIPRARSLAAGAVTRQMNALERDTLRAATERQLRGGVEPWARVVSTSLQQATIDALSAHGLPVTRRLLDGLAADLQQACAEVGGKELNDKRDLAQRQLAAVRGGAAGEERLVKAGDALLEQIAKHVRQTLSTMVDAWALEHLARVLADVRENLVESWRVALVDAEETLRAQARPTQGIKPFDLWPTNRGVPTHLRPSRVEHLLDDIEAFPRSFAEQVGRSVGEGFDVADGQGLENALGGVVTQVIAGKRLSIGIAEPLVTSHYRSLWVPLDGSGQSAPTRASVKLNLTLRDLEKRIHAWLHDDTKQIGRYLEETWATHLGGETLGDAERLSRHNRLVSQFAAALKGSRPLVKLDPQLVQHVHNFNIGRAPLSLIISPLNIPNDEGELQQRLQNVAIQEYGQLAALTFTSTPASAATALSTYATPYHAVEVQSIMEPVTQQYSALGTMVDFWKLRRARPLTEWVPLGPDAARALITGWFVGRCLGRARVEGKHPPQHVVYVEDRKAGGGAWVRLRQQGVRPATSLNQVGMLLELLALTFIDVSQTSSTTPLAPYSELIRLGSLVGSRVLSDPIREWVESGQGVVDASSSYFPSDLGSPSARAAALQQRCQALIDDYTKYTQDSRLGDITECQGNLFPEVIDLLTGALRSIMASAVAEEVPFDQ